MRTSAPYFGEAPRLSSESLKNVFPKETTSSLEKTLGLKHVLDTEEKTRFSQAVPVNSGQLFSEDTAAWGRGGGKHLCACRGLLSGLWGL